MTASRGKKAVSKRRGSAAPRRSSALAKPDATFASDLVRDLSEMIEAAQKQVSTVANVALTSFHWQIGRHVRSRVLEGRRAEYGGQIVSTASRQSTWRDFKTVERARRNCDAARMRCVP